MSKSRIQSSNNKKNQEIIHSLSIKEQMMGIKSTKPLPKDFYEKVLECEMALKEKFDMEVLGTLIKYYSLTIENFGSIVNENKYTEYIEEKYQINKGNFIKNFMLENICQLFTKGIEFINVDENINEFLKAITILSFMLKRMMYTKEDL